MFSNFLSETSDNKDLIFYLYNRSLLEKALKLNFGTLNTEELKSISLVKNRIEKNTKIHISLDSGEKGKQEIDIRHINALDQECIKLASTFFDASHQDLFAALLSVVFAAPGKDVLLGQYILKIGQIRECERILAADAIRVQEKSGRSQPGNKKRFVGVSSARIRKVNVVRKVVDL